jgi:hypothetical protein
VHGKTGAKATVVPAAPRAFVTSKGPLSLVTPSARTSAPKVRAFADAMKALVAARPDLFD